MLNCVSATIFISFHCCIKYIKLHLRQNTTGDAHHHWRITRNERLRGLSVYTPENKIEFKARLIGSHNRDPENARRGARTDQGEIPAGAITDRENNGVFSVNPLLPRLIPPLHRCMATIPKGENRAALSRDCPCRYKKT